MKKYLERYLKNKNFLLLIGAFLFLFAIHLFIKPSDGDDAFFINANRTSSYLSFIVFYYKNWSGRLIPNTLAYFLLADLFWLWRIVNPLVILFASYSTARIVKHKPAATDIIFCLCLFLGLNYSILGYSVFWATGSLNYIMPIACALYTASVFADAVLRENCNIENFGLKVTAAFLCACSNEQVSMCMVAFSVLCCGVMFWKKIKISWKHIIIVLIIILGAVMLFTAKGNMIRFEAEAQKFYPEFNELSITDHVFVGISWLYNMIFNYMKFSVISIMAAIVLSNKHKKNTELSPRLPFSVWQIMLCLMISALFISGYIEKLFFVFKDIKSIQAGISAAFLMDLFPYLFGAAFLFAIAWGIFKFAPKPFIFIFLAGICSLCMMWVSPTIFASGQRTLAVCCSLFNVIIFYFMNEKEELKVKSLPYLALYALVNVGNCAVYFLTAA